MYVCIGCVCMHAWVYEYLTHVCSNMCMCTHAYMYFWQYPPPPSIEVGRAGFAPPHTHTIEKLPTPINITLLFVNTVLFDRIHLGTLSHVRAAICTKYK